jgi:uncharacterized protein with FMN-binding domain
MLDLRKTMTAAACAVALGIPVADASAAFRATVAPKKKKKVVTVTKSVSGAPAQADRWGFVQVTLVVKKTTTTIGAKKTVNRKITAVKVPMYPDHTDRSVFINQQALPLLVQETLTAQFTGGVNMISGASNTSDAFITSLQGAITAAQQA